MRNVCFKALALALTVFGLSATAFRSEAQLVQTHLQFTSSWRYLATGVDQGTAWRAIGFSDSTWSGPSQGLIGFEDALAPYTIHAPLSTVLPNNPAIITYYFRTTFNFSGSTNGVTLYATNLVDDGCSIYLNGLYAGGVRLAQNATATTLATGGTEGALELVTIPAGLLRVGQNTIAVEVHQSGTASSDMMFGLKLVAITAQAAAITTQPQSVTAAVGEPASFKVVATGGPLTYRWQRNGVNLSATSDTLSFTRVLAANAGDYRVIVTSPINSVTSIVARLTVVADTDGPTIIANPPTQGAIIGNASFSSNSINVIFSELQLLSSTNGQGARNIDNYRLVPVNNTNVSVRITNILFSTSLGSLLYPDVNDPNWNPEGDFFLVLNNIADTPGAGVAGNNIAPYTRIGVSVPIVTPLTKISDPWLYYVNNFFDPEGFAIYRNHTSTAWYGMNYVVDLSGGLWAAGNGILWQDPNTQGQTCAGDVFNTQISFQNYPSLFRRTFVLPPTSGSNGILAFRFIVDDGMILYLNGEEIYRYNMPAGVPNENTKATTTFGTISCVTNVTIPLTSLKAGTNVIGAGIYQTTTPESDTIFGLEMDGIFYRTATPPPDPNTNQVPLRFLSTYNKAAKTLRLSWNTNYSGYSLMSRDYSGTDVGWTQVKDQMNPYTISIPSYKSNALYQIEKR